MATYYHRMYETQEDQAHNANLSNGAQGRKRSGSMGEIDSNGNRINRLHYHAQQGQATTIRYENNTGAHTNAQLRDDIANSFSPMNIPGAAQRDVVAHGHNPDFPD